MEHKITKAIEECLKEKRRVIVALDGRSASGKTTVAEKVMEATGCVVVHMDDFFVPKAKRRNEIGGNIDFERLIKEVLMPFKEGRKALYRPYLCKSGEYGEEALIENDVLLLEGAYSTHYKIEAFYDISFFMDIDKEEQLRRIKKRNPDNYDDFINIWIPREEEYFKTKKNG